MFYFIFVLIESRVLRGLAYSNWILRGFVYSFIGLIGLEQDLAKKVEDIAAGTTSVFGPDIGTLFAMLFVSITTWIIIGVGAIYAVLGLLCLQRWHERMEKDHTEKVNEWKRKKKQDEDFRKQQENQRQYERDREEGRGKWYDDLE
jgi:predicted membrane protein